LIITARRELNHLLKWQIQTTQVLEQFELEKLRFEAEDVEFELVHRSNSRVDPLH